MLRFFCLIVCAALVNAGKNDLIDYGEDQRGEVVGVGDVLFVCANRFAQRAGIVKGIYLEEKNVSNGEKGYKYLLEFRNCQSNLEKYIMLVS